MIVLPPLTGTQKLALLLVRKTPMWRTAAGWKGRGTLCIRHATARALIGKGLVATDTMPALHLRPTAEGRAVADVLAGRA